MAPDGACGVAQSAARSNAEFEAERFRKGFRKKHESVVESKLVRVPAPSANAGAAFASVAEHENACSSGDF